MGTGELIIRFLVIAAMGALIIFGIYAFNTWRAKREQARMRREADFKVWLDRVDTRLLQYGANQRERTLADWKIDFESGLSPDLAAKNFLGPSRIGV